MSWDEKVSGGTQWSQRYQFLPQYNLVFSNKWILIFGHFCLNFETVLVIFFFENLPCKSVTTVQSCSVLGNLRQKLASFGKNITLWPLMTRAHNYEERKLRWSFKNICQTWLQKKYGNFPPPLVISIFKVKLFYLKIFFNTQFKTWKLPLLLGCRAWLF